jgi:hypothetical protein
MSWLFASSPSSKNLPNGQAPPCFQCGKFKCECEPAPVSVLPGVPQAIIVTQQPGPIAIGTAVTGADAGVVNDAASTPKRAAKKANVPTKPASASAKQCQVCGETADDDCICPAAIEPRETKFRQMARIDERIENMLLLCADLHAAIGDDSSEIDLCSIQERGAHLAAQYAVIQKHMDHGVVTGALTAQHIEEVDAWMKRCDVFNVALCRVGSVKLTFPTTPGKAPSNGHAAGDVDVE